MIACGYMKKIADFCDICDNRFHGTFIKENGDKMLLCCKHLHHMQRHNRILERTTRDKNLIIDKKEYCELYLYDKYQNIKAISLFDNKFKSKIQKHKWGASLKGKKYYIKTDICDKYGNGKVLYLTNFILGEKDGYQIDHINGDTLDNRKHNLRFCTQQQNLMNKTEARGISFNKKYKKWETYIGVNKKIIRLGYYKDEKQALRIRRKAELKYYGKFAPKR